MVKPPPMAFTFADLLSCNVPALTVVVPVNVFADVPLKVSVPAPCFVRLPEPEITLAIVAFVASPSVRFEAPLIRMFCPAAAVSALMMTVCGASAPVTRIDFVSVSEADSAYVPPLMTINPFVATAAIASLIVANAVIPRMAV